MSTDETREALTAMVREGEAAGMYAALDVGAIRAEAERRYPDPINFDGEGNLWEHRRGGRLGFQSGAQWALAARDAEVARVRGSADAWWTEYDRELKAHEATKAEVERLTRIVNGYDRTPAEQRAADAEAQRDAARAALDRVRAMADELDVIAADFQKYPDQRNQGIAEAWRVAGKRLRVALDPEEPR